MPLAFVGRVASMATANAVDSIADPLSSTGLSAWLETGCPMKIALDGTPLTISSGGLRRYTEELAKALQELGETVEILYPAPPLWWSIRLPLRLFRVDVFHGTNFEVPYLPVCPAVMTVHDLSPWMNTEWHANVARVRRRAPALIRLGLATMLIVPSLAVRSQVLSMFAINPDRVVAIQEGAAIQRVQVPPVPRPYFLFVGTLEPRKNVPTLISAWQPLRERADLIIVGRRRSDAPEITPQPGLILAGEVTDDRLAELYTGAVAMVYPSLYEGFGLPVIEAMRCGAPVITSRDPALLETASDAAIHADPGELTEAMRSLLDNPDLRSRLAVAALRRGSEFTWKRTAERTREVYGEAIARARTLT